VTLTFPFRTLRNETLHPNVTGGIASRPTFSSTGDWAIGDLAIEFGDLAMGLEPTNLTNLSHPSPGSEFAAEKQMRPYVPQTIRQLQRLLHGISIGMLTTVTPAGDIRSRPMLMHDVDENGWLWFLTDRSSRKAWELVQNPHAAIAFQSPRRDRYVSVEGTAIVVRDDVRLRRMWNPTYRAWFPRGKGDPEIVLVAVRISRVEYWVVPRTRIARVAGAIKATVMRRRNEAGRHGVLNLHPLSA
jgi:general stress protein 26